MQPSSVDRRSRNSNMFLRNAQNVAPHIRNLLEHRLGKKVSFEDEWDKHTRCKHRWGLGGWGGGLGVRFRCPAYVATSSGPEKAGIVRSHILDHSVIWLLVAGWLAAWRLYLAGWPRVVDMGGLS